MGSMISIININPPLYNPPPSLPMDISPSFTLFEQLPSELRIKIWKFVLPGPRVVSVRFNRGAQQYTSSTTPPILLRACPESRNLALETYTNLILSPEYESSVFVDFTRDTIFFDSLDCSPKGDLSFDLAKSPHRDRILSCAIDVQLWEVLRVFRYESLSELLWMKNLKTIALIMLKEKEVQRGLHERQLLDDERDNRSADGDREAHVVDGANTNMFSAEIRHSYWYVECIRTEIEKHQKESKDAPWVNGVPNVQMWLW
jgi:hypothetical protein